MARRGKTESFPALNMMQGIDEIDAAVPIDCGATESAFIATITESSRLNRQGPTAPCYRFIESAEGVMMFSFGNDERGRTLLNVAREALRH